MSIDEVTFRVNHDLLSLFDSKAEEQGFNRTRALSALMAAVVTGTLSIRTEVEQHAAP